MPRIIFKCPYIKPGTEKAAAHLSKLRRKIREKKIAMGHKPDDHEDPEIAPRQI